MGSYIEKENHISSAVRQTHIHPVTLAYEFLLINLIPDVKTELTIEIIPRMCNNILNFLSET